MKPVFESEYDELKDNFEKYIEERKPTSFSCEQTYKNMISAEKKCHKNEIKIRQKWSKRVITRHIQENVKN